MSEWQPIETAPKDGKYILAVRNAVGHRAVTVIVFDEVLGWVGRTVEDEKKMVKYQPTHWMPLPEPPEATQ